MCWFSHQRFPSLLLLIFFIDYHHHYHHHSGPYSPTRPHLLKPDHFFSMTNAFLLLLPVLNEKFFSSFLLIFRFQEERTFFSIIRYDIGLVYTSSTFFSQRRYMWFTRHQGSIWYENLSFISIWSWSRTSSPTDLFIYRSEYSWKRGYRKRGNSKS